VKPVFVLLIILIPFFSFSQISGSVRFEMREFPKLPQKNLLIEAFLSGFPELNTSGLRDWFYWTNYSRHNPRVFWDSVVAPIILIYPQLNTTYAVSLKKTMYRVGSLPLVKPNKILNQLAARHALDIGAKGILSHSSSNGNSFQGRVFAGGISKCAAENLSVGLANPVFSLVLLFIDEGVADLGHRNNLLNPYYVEMGVGRTTTKKGQELVVQDFACNQSDR
jgi:hypothetical protein